MNFFIRWIVTAIAVAAAVWIVPGIEVVGAEAWVGVAFTALVLLLSLPVTVLTLGIFYLVVNTLMLYLAAWLANGLFGVGFWIASFGSAFVASIVISIVSGLMNGILGKE